MSRSTTSFSQNTTETRLPGLQRCRTRIDKRSVQQDDVIELKVKIHQMESEKKLLRAKIQRMKKIIQNRNNSIKKVLGQPQNKQSIQTATPSTLHQLKEEKASLKNALIRSQQELNEIKNSDKLALSDELKIEIRLFFEEKKRLDDQLASSKETENVLSQELNRLNSQIANISMNEKIVDKMQLEIDELTEKYFAYRKSEVRLSAAKDLHKLQRNPEAYDEIKEKLEKEINKTQEEIEKSNKELNYIQENEAKNLDYLNDVIQNQVDIIKECLKKMKPDQYSSNSDNSQENENEKDTED